MSVVEVGGAFPYRIQIEQGCLRDSASLTEVLKGNDVLIISDTNVAPLHMHALRSALDKAGTFNIRQHILAAGEAHKNFDSFRDALGALAAMGAKRDASVIALGGGVVGDLAGFAAACWMRGIQCIQMPTTLLAMVDSSVGGKTAIDIPEGKNLVGAFHPPAKVLIDPTVLETLPPREFAAGMAEVIKYGAIFDASFIDWLEMNVDAIRRHDPEVIAAMIAKCCQYKADVVARDLYETGDRALLNLGHTFGHAIEAEQGYGNALNHGEAVSVGMMLAARLSEALLDSPSQDRERLGQLLMRFDLPTEMPAGLDREQLLARMHLDKKADQSGLRFILWERLGQARVIKGVDAADVLRALE